MTAGDLSSTACVVTGGLGFIGSNGSTVTGRYGLERYYEETLAREGGNSSSSFFADLFLKPGAALLSSRSREGDLVTIDVDAKELHVELSDDEIEARLHDWVAPPARHTRGVFAKYAAMVSSASEGAVTRPL